MRQQQCHIAGRRHTDHPRQQAEPIVGEIIGTGIFVPVGIEWRAEPVDQWDRNGTRSPSDAALIRARISSESPV